MRRRGLRRRGRRLLALLIGLVLFAGGVWLAVTMAAPPAGKTVRVRGRSAQNPVAYQMDEKGQRVTFSEEIQPGKRQEFEMVPTEKGLLIRPVPGGSASP